MTTDLDLVFAEALANIFDRASAAASYNGTTIRAIVHGRADGLRQDPPLVIGDAQIEVRVADVPEPKRGDQVLLDGKVYRVEGISGDGWTWELSLGRQRVEV